MQSRDVQPFQTGTPAWWWSRRGLPNPQPEQPLRQEPPQRSIDLREERELTFDLLDDTRRWRERAVHELTLSGGRHISASSSYQIRLPLELVRSYCADVHSGDHVRLVLPVCAKPKQLLFDFSIDGFDESPVTLLLREEIARYQVAYIGRHSTNDPNLANIDALWFGICSFTGFVWKECLRKSTIWWKNYRLQNYMERENLALSVYLKQAFDLAIEVKDVTRWRQKTASTVDHLRKILDEPSDSGSPSDNILIALPFMGYKPDDVAAIDKLMDDFVSTVETLSESALQLVAEYGRRWEVLVDTVIPVDVPCTVVLADARPWQQQGVRQYLRSSILRENIVFGDATSVHIEIRTEDTGVKIKRSQVRDIRSTSGLSTDEGVATAVRQSPDAAAHYSADRDRPYIVEVSAKLRLAGWNRGQNKLAVILLVLAVIANLLLPVEESSDQSLLLLTAAFPLTLAGTVILIRETTPLAGQLLRPGRYLVFALIPMLWAVTLVRIVLA